jgi:hypothetical protein
MSGDSDVPGDVPDLEPQRSTHATPRVRKFFRLLGFGTGRDEDRDER